MFRFIVKGGPVMYPTLLGSIFGPAIVIERFLVFRAMRIDTFKFVQEIFKHIKENSIQAATELCDNTRHPIASIFKIGIELRNLPPQRLEKILEQAGNNQIQKLEKRLGALI